MATSDIYIKIGSEVIDEGDEQLGGGIGDRVVALTEEVAAAIRRSISTVAVQLRPDLAEIKASKATVKLGVKVVAKAGGLAALVTEIGGEGTIEVSIEFTDAAL
jgi:hypothetical protein